VCSDGETRKRDLYIKELCATLHTSKIDMRELFAYDFLNRMNFLPTVYFIPGFVSHMNEKETVIIITIDAEFSEKYTCSYQFDSYLS
jgi:hypothetical protein